ncbi:MAG: bifunctional (p)ppGpp synthetase/guanosine-3',5'-bis(diphosphate) 3'-pyrophosphohydrolase [Alphaproteobacteria bacterium]|nr:bifunctional (p)ppGpp synthetase/guanosine-3',5'-bis(diphosphate) 3'-pyrophosphohydrolase [Alphaproteobacteria bacterium]MCB9796678.1 bifunctional (p)ppGpp synthetase/guanosine-3',5'-bis(diphosphate) 3'-pyrophosphohydrolase [Alphaproteobacteria bacterium]
MSTRIEEARALALRAHGDQRYGEHPYAWHLQRVVELAEPYGEDAVVAAWLHDAVEDTPLTLDEVRAAFGDPVADAVDLVTDVEGPNRKARKAATYARLAAVPADGPRALALIVKAADRLANLRASRDEHKGGLLKMYQREHETFRRSAWRAGLCDDLWAEMDRIVAEGHARR